MEVLEVTKNNASKYIDQIANLEIEVLNKMENENKQGQLFVTGKEDILEYINSKDNSVFVAIDNDEVISACYITTGQSFYTYNDITKYFKYPKEIYFDYILKSKYNGDEEKFYVDMLDTYMIKLKAYNYAEKKILCENKQYNSMLEYLKEEENDIDNKFHEKSSLRENINKYMFEYVIDNYPLYKDRYEYFYHASVTDKGLNEFLNKHNINSINTNNKYEVFLSKLGYKIYEEPDFDRELYFSANPSNSIEIDTYLTKPGFRANGLSRIIVFEGIKKHILEYFDNEKDEELFLCSTLHRNNKSSKYVSEFFGLCDSIYVNRRNNRDREVHINRITKDDYKRYIDKMEAKLDIYYDYNPNNKEYKNELITQIYKEEEEYALKQIENGAKPERFENILEGGKHGK